MSTRDSLPSPVEERLTDIVVDQNRKRAERRFERLCARIAGHADLVDECCMAVGALHARGKIGDDARVYLLTELIGL